MLYYRIIIILLIISCGNPKSKVSTSTEVVNKPESLDTLIEHHEQSLNPKRVTLVKGFLNLFEIDFVSTKKVIYLFENLAIESEGFYFMEKCEKDKPWEECLILFRECDNNQTKCESLFFKEIKKNVLGEPEKSFLLEEFFTTENNKIILSSLVKVGNTYEAIIEDKKLKFGFRMNEARTRLVLSNVHVDSQSIFDGMW